MEVEVVRGKDIHGLVGNGKCLGGLVGNSTVKNNIERLQSWRSGTGTWEWNNGNGYKVFKSLVMKS